MVSIWIAVAAFMFGGIIGFALMAIIAIGRVSDDDFGRDNPSMVPETLPDPKPTKPHQLTFISANGRQRPRLLTAKQAAKRIGMSERWLYDNASNLPFSVRMGRRSVRFESGALTAWLKERKELQR